MATHSSTLAWKIPWAEELSAGYCPWGISRQEYWSGLSYPPPGDLLNLGTEPRSPTLQVDSLRSEPPGKLMNTGIGSPTFLQGIFLT